MMQWKAPEISVQIGETEKTGSVLSMEVSAARHQPVASVFLELSNIHSEWNDGASDEDSLVINWGWRGEDMNPLFNGTVKRSHLRETLYIWGLCQARSLMDTKVTRTYQNEEANAIIQHLVGSIDFSTLYIVSSIKIIDKLPLHNNTIVEAIQFLNRRLQLSNAFWCDPSGSFHWGPRDYSQESLRTFTHGDDVISFESLPGDRFLLTVMGTPVWHSQIISILDRDGDETKYFVEQVRHTIGIENEGARSRLWLQEVEHE